MPPKKKVVSTEPKENKGKELFDFVNMIQQDGKLSSYDNLTEVEKKKYKTSRYMIHRFLSMNPAYAPVVNAVQKYTQMPERAHYQFLTGIIPKSRQFNRYIKGSKDDRYETWLVELVASHYNISKVEATTYLDIYYEHDKTALREICTMYGVDPKTLKKVKL